MTAQQDFAHLKTMAEEGKMLTVIDCCFHLHEITQPYEYVDQGHNVGNVGTSVSDNWEKNIV